MKDLTNTDQRMRGALLADARIIHELVNAGADKGEMLPRSLNEIYESLRDFQIYWGEDGQLLGVCALHISWAGWAEIRSLYVREEDRGCGIGTKLVEKCLEDARRLGVDRVFTLTYRPGFFERIGFRLARKSDLPQKVWGDCLNCPKFPDCDEVALVRPIAKR